MTSFRLHVNLPSRILQKINALSMTKNNKFGGFLRNVETPHYLAAQHIERNPRRPPFFEGMADGFSFMIHVLICAETIRLKRIATDHYPNINKFTRLTKPAGSSN